MSLEAIICPICGSNELIETSEGIYTCKYCRNTIKDTTPGIDVIINNAVDKIKQEQYFNAKRNLFNEAQSEFLSDNRMAEWIKTVLMCNPNDFLANYYGIALNGTATDLNNYINDLDRVIYKEYLEEVIRFAIKTTNNKNVIQAVKVLIDEAGLGLDLYYEYISKLEDLAQKLDEGIYKTDITRDVFIAYSSKDSIVVNKTVAYLEENGFTCFTSVRNLRHGKGAVENYQNELENALRHCKCVLFISTENSRSFDCDALQIELPFVLETLPDMGRIEYLVEPYGAKTTDGVRRYLKYQVFKDLEYCKSLEDLCERIIKYKSKRKEVILDKPSINEKNGVVLFGMYPQTLEKNMDIVRALNHKVKPLPTDSNSGDWTPYPYYIGGVQKAFMWFIDVPYLDNRYRGVIFSQYRPYFTNLQSSTKFSYQDDNKFVTNEVYWFKYEIIKWDIIDEKRGKYTLLSQNILDAQEFNTGIEEKIENKIVVFPNNWEYSSLRIWLNETFYETSFSKNVQDYLLVEELDNKKTTSNKKSEFSKTQNNTKDKVYLLSFKETNSKKFKENNLLRPITDYARCQGAYVYGKSANWWLRSPSEDGQNDANVVDLREEDILDNTVYCSYNGVVPVVNIKGKL